MYNTSIVPSVLLLFMYRPLNVLTAANSVLLLYSSADHDDLHPSILSQCTVLCVPLSSVYRPSNDHATVYINLSLGDHVTVLFSWYLCAICTVDLKNNTVWDYFSILTLSSPVSVNHVIYSSSFISTMSWSVAYNNHKLIFSLNIKLLNDFTEEYEELTIYNISILIYSLVHRGLSENTILTDRLIKDKTTHQS